MTDVAATVEPDVDLAAGATHQWEDFSPLFALSGWQDFD
jgi:hypothetical protein